MFSTVADVSFIWTAYVADLGRFEFMYHSDVCFMCLPTFVSERFPIAYSSVADDILL